MANTTSSKLETYCLFKLDTSFESYLNTITLNKYKFALSRFRLSSHNLALGQADITIFQKKIEYAPSVT